MNTHALACLAVALALGVVATPARAQSDPAQASNTSAQGAAETPNRPAVARTIRKAQLMAEFKGLLEQSQAPQGTAAAPNPSTATASAVSNAPSASAGPSDTAMAPTSQAPAVRWPKDPGLDYTGFSCEYFTRPPAAQASTSLHPEGAWVAYGERMYQCVNQRWRMAGPVAAYADGAQRQAGFLER